MRSTMDRARLQDAYLPYSWRCQSYMHRKIQMQVVCSYPRQCPIRSISRNSGCQKDQNQEGREDRRSVRIHTSRDEALNLNKSALPQSDIVLRGILTLSSILWLDLCNGTCIGQIYRLHYLKIQGITSRSLMWNKKRITGRKIYWGTQPLISSKPNEMPSITTYFDLHRRKNAIQLQIPVAILYNEAFEPNAVLKIRLKDIFVVFGFKWVACTRSKKVIVRVVRSRVKFIR